MLEVFKSLLLDKDSSEPLYMQLYRQIASKIHEGLLLPGLRLPSVRSLAQALQVNTVTVVSAYRKLEEDGLAYAQTGSGTYVSKVAPLGDGSFLSEEPLFDEFYPSQAIPLMQQGRTHTSRVTYNFASATPTPEQFPITDFKNALNLVLDRDGAGAFGYHDSQGYTSLRQSLVRLLANRGIHAATEDLQIISGSQQGLDILSKVLLQPGHCVVVESPTYTGAIAVFRSRGAEILEMELSHDGPNLDQLEFLLRTRKPKLIYCIPSFQNPTGASYSLEKRKALLELARRYHTWVVEDDYVSDLDFESLNLPALKSLDAEGNVIFLRSFSKLFMPGLRLGMLLVPPQLRTRILEAKHTTDISTPGLLQRAFDAYITSGGWDNNFRTIFQACRERYYCTLDALSEHREGLLQYHRPGGGLNLWMTLPLTFPVHVFLNRCTSEGVHLAPGTVFYSGANTQLNSFRLSFAAVAPEDIGPGIELMLELLRDTGRMQVESISLPIL